MTRITKNGVGTTKAPGQERYEIFSRKVGSKTKKYVQYDYRHSDGALFSCVSATLKDCRAARNEWLKGKEV